MFTITPKQIYDEILAWGPVKVVPYFAGPPGVGKSAGVQKFAADYNLKLIDIRLATCSPEDLTGLPMRDGNGKATFAPFDMFPLENDPLPEGYDGWLLFLDEISSAGKQMQGAGYKLVLDRLVGNHRLHNNVICVAAGNRAIDKAVVNQMSTAMQSRLAHYEIEVNHQETLDYFIRAGYDHRIVSFLQFRPSMLMAFNPEHSDKTFACPRTWDFLSRVIKGKEVSPAIGHRVAAVVGTGAATEFIGFAQEYDRLPTLQAIIDDPSGISVPPEMSTKYATVGMLSEKIDNDNCKALLTYLDRFPAELKVIFARYVEITKEAFAEDNEDYHEFRSRHVRYLSNIAA